MQEVVDRNQAIEALKKQVDTLEAEKTQLVGEVGGLRTAQPDLEGLRKNVDSLIKEVDGANIAQQLATERALKAIETADNLRKEEDAEMESSAALKV